MNGDLVRGERFSADIGLPISQMVDLPNVTVTAYLPLDTFRE